MKTKEFFVVVVAATVVVRLFTMSWFAFFCFCHNIISIHRSQRFFALGFLLFLTVRSSKDFIIQDVSINKLIGQKGDGEYR